MDTSELISIARRCGDRTTDCKTACPFYGQADCTVQLINALADNVQEYEQRIFMLNSDLAIARQSNRHIKGLYEAEKAKVQKAKEKLVKYFKETEVEETEKV